MEDGQYTALTDYLKKGEYPYGFSKGQKYSLRTAAKSYKLEAGKLYYVDTRGGNACNVRREQRKQ